VLRLYGIAVPVTVAMVVGAAAGVVSTAVVVASKISSGSCSSGWSGVGVVGGSMGGVVVIVGCSSSGW